jgi:hypothetical protein
MTPKITAATSLDTLKKTAKRWLKALRDGNVDARERLARAHTALSETPTLRDVQHALAREYGFDSWIALTNAVAQPLSDETASLPRARTAEEHQRLAEDMVLAFDARDETALQRCNEHYQRSFTFEDLWAEIWRRVYAFRQRAFEGPEQYLQLAEAQTINAQDAGFASWSALQGALATSTPPVPAYEIDAAEGAISPRRQLTENEWDELIAVMKERRLTALNANGQMTDAVMARLSALDHVSSLNLGGSRQLSDDGLLHLARMPQLERLDLSEYPGGRLTDRGLEVLRHLPALRSFEMTWQRGITDAGVAHLKSCDRLERVNLMGSPTGDGAIAALQGKPRLWQFSTGRLVTDAGLPLLHNFPMLKTWHGGEIAADAREAPNAGRLLIDGPFTNQGLAGLAGLEGVFDLDLFWHVSAITSEGFGCLAALPNLLSLGADGALSDDAAMRHFAAIPRLRRLRAQGTVASDDGFESLSRSRTLQFLWGRECPNLGSRGFVALSGMPALRGLGVSCKNVDDAALATLPEFPSLHELTPIDVTDEGFRHVGRCERLDRLTCMYCRETTDAGTAHIAGLQRVRYYYAGLTRITDRSLEILGGMSALERIELYECQGITDAGLSFLAAMPRLREVHLDGLSGVTFEGTRVFPAGVRVKYST